MLLDLGHSSLLPLYPSEMATEKHTGYIGVSVLFRLWIYRAPS